MIVTKVNRDRDVRVGGGRHECGLLKDVGRLFMELFQWDDGGEEVDRNVGGREFRLRVLMGELR